VAGELDIDRRGPSAAAVEMRALRLGPRSIDCGEKRSDPGKGEIKEPAHPERASVLERRDSPRSDRKKPVILRAEPKAERSETPMGLWGKPPISCGAAVRSRRSSNEIAFERCSNRSAPAFWRAQCSGAFGLSAGSHQHSATQPVRPIQPIPPSKLTNLARSPNRDAFRERVRCLPF
jgi:hypothetical protein